VDGIDAILDNNVDLPYTYSTHLEEMYDAFRNTIHNAYDLDPFWSNHQSMSEFFESSITFSGSQI
jgi:hypothetical protein